MRTVCQTAAEYRLSPDRLRRGVRRPPREGTMVVGGKGMAVMDRRYREIERKMNAALEKAGVEPGRFAFDGRGHPRFSYVYKGVSRFVVMGGSPSKNGWRLSLTIMRQQMREIDAS